MRPRRVNVSAEAERTSIWKSILSRGMWMTRHSNKSLQQGPALLNVISVNISASCRPQWRRWESRRTPTSVWERYRLHYWQFFEAGLVHDCLGYISGQKVQPHIFTGNQDDSLDFSMLTRNFSFYSFILHPGQLDRPTLILKTAATQLTHD